MSQKEVEIILARHLASYLAMPIFIVNPEGSLIYYNESAEAILGRRYEETGEMPLEVWSTIYAPTDEAGMPFAPDALPLSIALNKRQTASARFWIRGLDEVKRHIEATAFPLIGQDNRYLGALALFWELDQ
jgi:PAS domain-containing protein